VTEVCTREDMQMPSQNGNGGRGGPLG
jgi:hypothetical protein